MKTSILLPIFLLALLPALSWSADGVATPAAEDPAPYLKTANERLPKLREELLHTLDESRQANPQQFKTVVEADAVVSGRFLHNELKPVDMTKVVKAAYSDYNPDIWRYRTISEELNRLSLVYALPESPLAGKPEVAAKAAQGFEWILGMTSPEGSCQAPDSNLDRFAYTSYWDAFVLFAPALPDDLRQRFLKMMLAAGDYQQKTYGVRPFPFGGGYPNMDAAYMLVMEQGYRLFGKESYVADLDHRIAQLRDRLSGAAWEYLAGWNPQPGYSTITLEWAARNYQLSGKADLLNQIKVQADYYKYYVEPSGLMDYGMVPFIKHDWNRAPYEQACGSLELVNRYAPNPFLQDEIDRMHQASAANPALLTDPRMLYWISHDSGQRQTPPAAFVRAAPEIVGFQGRATGPAGTLTAYATGKETAVDTRISAMVSGPDGQGISLLGGAFLELIQDGTSYYLGDMHPKLDLHVDAGAAVLKVTQIRHMMGPKSKPLMLGNHIVDIKNWKFDCWKGGSPDGPPVQTEEVWSWKGERLTGEITLTAQAEAKLDGVQLTLPVLLSNIDQSRALPGGTAGRYGHLCVAAQGEGNGWTTPNGSNPFDFRADLPSGDYQVTLVSGDADFQTDPFDVAANGEKVATNVTAPQGSFTERTFPVKVTDGALLLKFLPQRTGNHWKVDSLKIVSADGKTARKFAVGPSGKPPAAGFLSIAGANVYNVQRGYGWNQDMTGQERHRAGSGGPIDLITCPGNPLDVVLRLDTPDKWEKGKVVRLHVVIGIGEDLDAWLKANPQQ